MTDFNIIPVDGYRIIKTRLEDGTLKLSRVPSEGKVPDQEGQNPVNVAPEPVPVRCSDDAMANDLHPGKVSD